MKTLRVRVGNDKEEEEKDDQIKEGSFSMTLSQPGDIGGTDRDHDF